MKERLIVRADLTLIDRGRLIDLMDTLFKNFKFNYIKEGTNIGKGIFLLEGEGENLLQLRKSLNIVRIEGKGDVSPFKTEGVPLE